MAFNMFPWSNLHNLNTDWILKTIKELKTAAEQAASTVAGYASRLLQAEQDIDALEGSRVSYAAEQHLTSGQQSTARGNIGAAPAVGVVMYNEAQALSSAYKAQARENIGAAAAGDIPGVTGVVHYDEAQSLTDGQKIQARANIGAAAASVIPDISDVLRYSSQSLTDEQKTQARSNIGAMSSEGNLPLEVKIRYSSGGYSMDQDMDDILLYIESSVPVVITCVDVSTWPGFSSFTNLRDVSISQLHVIRSGSSNDFDIVGDALLSFDDTTRELQILHLNLSILSGFTSIYPTLWGMLGAPLATEQDVGKWLKVDAYGYPVWAALPVYQGGVS